MKVGYRRIIIITVISTAFIITVDKAGLIGWLDRIIP